MKILFKNTTKYDKENQDNFKNFHKNKYGKKELVQLILIMAIMLYLLIFNMIFKNWLVVLILVLISLFIYLIKRYMFETGKEKNKKQKNKEYTFFFYEKYIKIKSKRQFDRVHYFELKKIFETRENFFLYTDDNHSLILDKEGFIIGNSKEFSEFIKKKCPFKYKK